MKLPKLTILPQYGFSHSYSAIGAESGELCIIFLGRDCYAERSRVAALAYGTMSTKLDAMKAEERRGLRMDGSAMRARRDAMRASTERIVRKSVVFVDCGGSDE